MEGMSDDRYLEDSWRLEVHSTRNTAAAEIVGATTATNLLHTS